MADEAQFRRIRALNLCVNLFANHIFHWGDIHHDVTMVLSAHIEWTLRKCPRARDSVQRAFRCADHADGAAVHRLVRGQPR